MSARAAAISLMALALAAPAWAGDLPPGASLRLGESSLRAGGPVAELAFSEDGRELTSRVPVGEATTRVAVWDAATGAPLRTATEPRRPTAAMNAIGS